MDDFIIGEIPQNFEEYVKFYNNLPEEEKCNYNTPELVAATTEKVNLQNEYYELRKQLSDTDYVVIKIAEGVSTKEEYKDVLKSRQAWRKKINIIIDKMSQFNNYENRGTTV